MRALWILAACLVAACDCSGGPSAGPCTGPEPNVACGRDCADRACPSTLYCGPDMRCTADCDPATSDGCRASQFCTADGRCEDLTGDASRPDAPQADVPDHCASVRIEARRVTPNVVLVIDQSGSMREDFPGAPDRWRALRNSLLDEAGLIRELESTVRFGMALYSSRFEDGAFVGMCPLVTTIEPALDNFDAIDAIYGDEDPIDETPTGDSLDFVLDWLESIPDPSEDPTIFILATDGEPDSCEEPNPQTGQGEAIAAVERAYRSGIRTFIISVGEGTVSAEHLQDVANAGLGVRAGDPDAEYWEAGDDAGLRDALRSIIGGELSCVIEFDGAVDPEEACSGEVRLNGRLVPACDEDNGWVPVDESHIELRGDACTELQETEGVTLEAEFPCDVVLI